AGPGDTVEVHGGVYPGPLLIDRPVVLVGTEGATLDGRDRGTVVTLAAPGITLRGFAIRGSGADLNAGDAGVEITAPSVVVERNALADVLNGLSLDNARGGIVRDNAVEGKRLDEAYRGDAIRLWYSPDALVDGNSIRAARDFVVWYSSRPRIRNNR